LLREQGEASLWDFTRRRRVCGIHFP